MRPPAGLSLIEAPTAQDEAEVIALILREAANTPGRTAALVSPDRLLARRVAVRLEAWGIKVDDSAGRPFAKTPPGAFLDLVINAVAKSFAPRELMALLKHPLTRLGLDPFAARRAARALEIAAFRDGLSRRRARRRRSSARTGRARDGGQEAPRPRGQSPLAGDWDGARDLVARLQACRCAADDGRTRAARNRWPDFARAHVAAAEADRARSGGGRGRGARIDRCGRARPERKARASSPVSSTKACLRSRSRPPTTPISIAASSRHERAPARPRASAALHLGSVRGAPAADRRGHPRLAQRRHVAASPPIRAHGSTGRCAKQLGLPSPEEKIGHAAHDFATLLRGAARGT